LALLIRVQKYYHRKASTLLFKKTLMVSAQRPLISFSFDDFPESAFRTGGTILRHFGLNGTYYASLGLLGKDSESGRIFGSTDLKLICKQGHELGCHTFSHCHSGNTATRIFEEAIIENRNALRTLLPGAEFRAFAYPISCPRPLTKLRTSKYFMCCRGGGQTYNVGSTDLNNLAAFFLEKSRDAIRPVRDLIDQNRQARGWLIFATHDISDNPTPYGCTPTFFEEVVRCAVDSGACILPVVKALEVLMGGGDQERVSA
jgi:peptidoglycan/xylan/chitin deacetylase (PgdA/CDA1 family)